MGEVVALPRRPRPEPEPPWRPPAAPAVALPRTGVLAIIGFRRGMHLASRGLLPQPRAASAVVRGHQLGERLLSQPLIAWQPQIIAWQPRPTLLTRLRRLFA